MAIMITTVGTKIKQRVKMMLKLTSDEAKFLTLAPYALLRVGFCLPWWRWCPNR